MRFERSGAELSAEHFPASKMQPANDAGQNDAGQWADPASRIALVVDLDRTLVTGDIAVEAMVKVARSGIMALLGLIWAMCHGRAALKTYLARRCPVDPTVLAYRPEVLSLIVEARAMGRPVILATAAHWRNARRVAAHLGLFDSVIASGRRGNAKGAAKLTRLRAALGDPAGEATFDYIGDSPADRAIWNHARTAYTVGVATGCASENRLSRPRTLPRALFKASRPHQWAKNALVFVPLATSGLIAKAPAILHAAIAFAIMSVIASSVYLLNDLLDVDADRLHATKRRRPIASGDLPVPIALAAAIVFAAGGLIAAKLWLGNIGLAAMGTYFALTLAYSFRLKSAMIADVLTLACLYTIRIVAGAAAIAVPVSSWLLLFSVFFFLSLGYLKRYIELSSSSREHHELLSGRGYTRSDAEIVAISGIAAGMVSILIIVLFAEAMGRVGPGTTGAYLTPQLLWLLPLPLLYWMNRIWMMSKRGEVDGDPVAFAVTDRKSIAVGACLGVIVLTAKFAALGGPLLALGAA